MLRAGRWSTRTTFSRRRPVRAAPRPQRMHPGAVPRRLGRSSQKHLPPARGLLVTWPRPIRTRRTRPCEKCVASRAPRPVQIQNRDALGRGRSRGRRSSAPRRASCRAEAEGPHGGACGNSTYVPDAIWSPSSSASAARLRLSSLRRCPQTKDGHLGGLAEQIPEGDLHAAVRQAHDRRARESVLRKPQPAGRRRRLPLPGPAGTGTAGCLSVASESPLGGLTQYCEE